MMATAPKEQVTLRGRRVLVAEDEYMIAEEIAVVLGESGVDVLGPLPTVEDAMRPISTEGQIDGALLDVNLGAEAIWPVVDALLARAVPVVLATGYNESAIPKAYSHLPRCEKPATGQDFARALAGALASQSSLAGADCTRSA